MQRKEISRANVLLISWIILLALWIVAFYEGISTAIKVWYVSEIYNHCFLILPCAFYFIYQKRNQILTENVTANYWLILPLSLIFFSQLFAQVGDINILMHIASFVALPLMLWFVLGNDIGKKIAMPLCLILLSIPVGDQLIPYLQELTTDIAVPMLEYTGVPIYRNGLYLDIPEGRFLVAEACSGISFLITSVAFGFIYSYASFQSNKKRILFIFVSVVVPIAANAIRVYGIILTGHLTDMEHAVGADHLIYGGVFYGIVLFILILIGERFRDSHFLTAQIDKAEVKQLKNKEIRILIKSLLLITLLLIIKQIWLLNIEAEVDTHKSWRVAKAVNSVSFIAKENRRWRPQLQDSTLVVEGEVLIEGNKIDFYGAYFNEMSGELVSSQHRMFDDKYWSVLSRGNTWFGDKKVNKVLITAPQGSQRYIFYWYQLNEEVFTSQTKVKLFQTYKKLIKSNATGSLMAVSLPVDSADISDVQLNSLPNFMDMILNMFHEQLNSQITNR